MSSAEDQRQTLTRLIAAFSTISTVLTFFVVLTHLLFPEKRKTSTSRLVLFQALMAMGLEAIFMLPGYVPEQLDPLENQPLCYFQAAALMFFGNCISLAWFSITLNLYHRWNLDKDEIAARYPIMVSVVVSILLSSIPFMTHSVTNDGIYCFINSQDAAVLYTCFYGLMIAMILLGTPLWVLVISRVYVAVVSERGLERSSERRSLLVVEGQVQGVQPVEYRQKLVLLVRQTCYVTAYLIIADVILANRITISISNPTFTGWVIHITAVGMIGVAIFLVFGLSQRNFQLWRGLVSPCTRKTPSEQTQSATPTKSDLGFQP